MVAGVPAGNISAEATSPFGNIFADAMRRTERRDHQQSRRIHLTLQEICPKNRSHPLPLSGRSGGLPQRRGCTNGRCARFRCWMSCIAG